MKTRALLMALTLIISASALTSCGAADKNEAMDVTSSAAGGEVVNAEKAVSAEKADDADGGEEAEAFAPEAAAEKAADGELAIMDAADIGSEDFLSVGEETPEVPADDDTLEPAIPDNGGDAFVLTAGEWNDNDNWGFFTNLVNNETIAFPQFGLSPEYRIAVTLTNDGKPVSNQKVTLMDGDKAVWSAYTNKDGNAYLFAPADVKVEYTVIADGAEPTKVEAGKDAGESGQGTGIISPEITLETGSEGVSYNKTQVMFILDTTGSMGDEIAYLQKDFASIAEETGGEGVTFSVNFYKDKGDDYVTSCNDFTDDIKAVQKMLNKENASGGGDTPEAVAEILDETMNASGWSEDTNKIAFLIFDAPPHTGTDQTIQSAVKKAAEQGIKLVPVVASNADRETELFGRAAAIMTGANYVFLTDDSGVGGSHLEPIIGSYDVELLHDIIVRNINSLRTSE